MSDFNQKSNTVSKNHGNKKKIIAAVSVIAVIAALLITFLAAKNTIFFSLAAMKAENGEYKSAVTLAEKSSSEAAEVIKDYAVLRIDINKYYPLLLSDFNIEKINEWNQKALDIDSKSYLLSESLSEEILELSTALSEITECCEEYNMLKTDILDMMDVFAEINRLHTKDSEGKNTAFTVAEERARINRWSAANRRMLTFVANMPRCENIYLANFLAKEAQGELAEFEQTISDVAATYSETDLVRFSGDVYKQYPDINNSNGQRVNLLEKEIFEQFMYEEICTELVRSLARYYNV